MYIYNGVLVTTEFQICLKRNIYDSYDTNLRASFLFNVPSSMYHKHADNSMSTPNAGMTHTCKMYTLALALGWLTHPISSLSPLPCLQSTHCKSGWFARNIFSIRRPCIRST